MYIAISPFYYIRRYDCGEFVYIEDLRIINALLQNNIIIESVDGLFSNEHILPTSENTFKVEEWLDKNIQE